MIVDGYSITPIEYVNYCMDTMTLLPLLHILPDLIRPYRYLSSA